MKGFSADNLTDGAELNAELERGRQLATGEPAQDELRVTPRMAKKK